MRFDTKWNQLGLYRIPSTGAYQSYFLKRSWGNYLFFPHPDVERMYPFILASGGIYKVFDSALPYPHFNKVLFDKFGAATIGPQRDFHEDFLIEKLGADYFDVDLGFSAGVFRLRVKEETFLFVDTLADAASSEGHVLPRLR